MKKGEAIINLIKDWVPKETLKIVSSGIRMLEREKICCYTEVGHIKNQYPRFRYKSACGLDVVQMHRTYCNGKEIVEVPISGKCMKCRGTIKLHPTTVDDPTVKNNRRIIRKRCRKFTVFLRRQHVR